VAPALRPPVDSNFDRRFLELPLAPVLPTRVRRLWRAAGRRDPGPARSAARRVWVSAVIHDLGMWGLGRGTEFHSVSGFFLLMGIGAAVEHAFKRLTGRRVGGFWGWAWTMAWTLGWGTLIIDAWARRGLVARDFSPEWLRPGKLLLNTIISHL
jgi:hypothetical protein